MNALQVEGLKKELNRVRAKAQILEKCILLKCDIRDCAMSVKPEDGWKSPEGFPIAVSFEAFGGNNALVDVGIASFVVYGSDLESIREIGLYYASQKYGSSSLYKERIEDQSQVWQWVLDQYDFQMPGEKIEHRKERLEIVGIYPMFDSEEGVVDETVYVCLRDDGRIRYLRYSQVTAMPEYNWENEDFGLLNAD